MKPVTLLVILFALCALVIPTFAQATPDLITLNDATPAIDAVITLPADTTGAIALDFVGAAVKLTDANGAVVFKAADTRLHGLQMNIAPNSGMHTLTVERLPGVSEAYVQIISLPELTQSNLTQMVSDSALTLNQSVMLPLNTDHPGDMVKVNIPADSVGVIMATFPGANATTQVVDATGMVVAESKDGHIDGMNLVLDAGDYQFTVLGNNLSVQTMAGISAISAIDSGFTVLQAPENLLVSSDNTSTAACSATIAVNAANLRTGPGTGYTISGYGYHDQIFAIGGQNTENNWVLIATDRGSAWVARSNIDTQGNCADLTVFNVPLRNAQPAPIIITSTGQALGSGSTVNVAPPQIEQHEEEHEDEHDNDD